jgi:PRTRC genetic system protein E
VFVELMPLLKDRTLLLTIARVGEKVKVNVIPAKAKEGEDQALTTPLTYTASPEELDAELGKHLSSYVDTHVALGSTLAEAKAEMDAAARAARQKAKATQAPKTEPSVAKKQEATMLPTTTEATPSLFSAPQSAEPPESSPGEERKSS